MVAKGCGQAVDRSCDNPLSQATYVRGSDAVATSELVDFGNGLSSAIDEDANSEWVLPSETPDSTRLRRLRRYTTPCELPPVRRGF